MAIKNKISIALCLLLACCITSGADAPEVVRARMDVYLQALLAEKKLIDFRNFLKKVINMTPPDDIPRLLSLGKLGMQNNCPEIAVFAYETVYKEDPGNITALRNMAIILYQSRKYPPALKYMEIYNKKTGGNYLTIYYEAELNYILRKELGPAQQSRALFEKAISEARQLGSSSREAQEVIARSYFRLNELEKAFAIFKSLMQRYPDDVFIRLDFARMLEDSFMMDEAFAVLKPLPEDLYAPKSLSIYNLTGEQNKDVIVRIVTMRIAYYLSKRHFFTVKRMEDELKKHYPKNAEAALSRVAFYGSFGNWRKVLHNLKIAQAQYPDDGTLVMEIERVKRTHGSYVQDNFGVRLTDNNSVEMINEASGELRISDDLRLGMEYYTDVARLNKLTLMDGEESNFRGVRSQTHIYLQGDLLNGDTARISFFDHDGIPGAGAEYTMLDFYGTTSLTGAWRRPYWDQQQAIAERGSRTYLELTRVFTPWEWLVLSATGSYNSYGLQHSDDLVRSMAFNSRIDLTLPKPEIQRSLLGDNSAFTLTYDLDMEYYSKYKKRSSDGGDLFAVSNRQVHTFLLGFYNEFTADLIASASCGYAVDVLGDNTGPVYSASLAYWLTKEIQVSATISQAITSIRYLYAGIGLKYNFTPETLVGLIEKYRGDYK